MTPSEYIRLALVAALAIGLIFLFSKFAKAEVPEDREITIQKSIIIRMWEKLKAIEDAYANEQQNVIDLQNEVLRLRSKLGCA